ncbi:hypothetical protein [Jannaschia marina]|uniref:hypothetical protein n=1 Tax=Jannaschia marina TaxID=2741674 RepID=UPI001ABBAD5D|nr:hypothetical protein [Jannaschia marina]
MKSGKWGIGGPGAVVLPALAVVLMPVAAHAYVGPGAGLTAIGTMIALLAALVLALVGFVWYPIKRMRRARKEKMTVQASHETKS